MPKNSFVFSFKTTDFVKYHLQLQKISPPSQHRRKASISLRVFYTKGSLTRILGIRLENLFHESCSPNRHTPAPEPPQTTPTQRKAPQRPARDRQTPPQPLPSPEPVEQKKIPPKVNIFRNT